MEVSEALKLLKTALSEISDLQKLPRNNPEYKLWNDKITDILKAAFGVKSDEYTRFAHAVGSWMYMGSEAAFQREYQEHLTRYETALKSIIQKYEILGIPSEVTTPSEKEAEPPKAFIAHGGKSIALDNLKAFLTALGVEPLIVEEQASEGREKEQQVDKYFKEADCEIVLATYGEVVDQKTGAKHPRLNVIDELARGRARFPNKVILLLEKDVELPTNVSGIVYERFTKDNMTDAFIKVAKELTAFGVLKATEPGKPI